MVAVNPPLVVIVGPTASGKSDLAMYLAEKFNGELICADSQTIRRGMDIGTAKPTAADRAKVAHHLLDIIDPYESFSVAQFKERVTAAISNITSRGKLPIMVGGTGLYVDAVLYNFSFRQPANQRLRRELNQKSITELQAMHRERGIPLPNNLANARHLVRNLETGGQADVQEPLRDNTLVLGTQLPTEELNNRISQRVETMLAAGWLAEVQGIVKQFGPPPAAWDAIGYQLLYQKVIAAGLDHVDQATTQALIIASKRYAKRQRTWFKRNQSIHYVVLPTTAEQLVATFLSK